MKCKVCQADLAELVKALGAEPEFCPKCGAGIEKSVADGQPELPAEILTDIESVPEEHRGAIRKAVEWAADLLKGKKIKDDDKDDADDKCSGCNKPYADCSCDDDDKYQAGAKKSLYDEFEALLEESIDGRPILKAIADELVEIRKSVQSQKELTKSLTAVPEIPAWATELQKSIADTTAKVTDVCGFVERIRQHPAAAQIGAAVAGDGVAEKSLQFGTEGQNADVLPKNTIGLIKALGSALEQGKVDDRRVIDTHWLRMQTPEKIAELEALAAQYGYAKV